MFTTWHTHNALQSQEVEEVAAGDFSLGWGTSIFPEGENGFCLPVFSSKTELEIEEILVVSCQG